MSQIERVAKAICLTDGRWCDGRKCIAAGECQRGGVMMLAEGRAAIMAMREPTPEMIEAGEREMPAPKMLANGYKAMMDAALKGEG